MPVRSTSGFHQPGTHCLHQARSAVRCSASRMNGELHLSKDSLQSEEGSIITLGRSLRCNVVFVQKERTACLLGPKHVENKHGVSLEHRQHRVSVPRWRRAERGSTKRKMKGNHQICVSDQALPEATCTTVVWRWAHRLQYCHTNHSQLF